jgi:hypothetical protein
MANPKLYCDANYDGQHPPVGVAVTGPNPGDLFAAQRDGGWKLYVAVANGIGNQVIWTDSAFLQPSNGNADAIQSVPVSAEPPVDGQALVFNETAGEYEPATVSGASHGNELGGI